jgi:hypothetical protein
VVDRFKHHGGARRPRNFSRAVMRMIVADNQFTFPTDL